MYFRVSTSESGWIYSVLSHKGTKKPSNHEIRDPSIRVALETKTFWELYGSNSSYIAPVTKTYIYYDTYLYFSGLEEQQTMFFSSLRRTLAATKIQPILRSILQLQVYKHIFYIIFNLIYRKTPSLQILPSIYR